MQFNVWGQNTVKPISNAKKKFRVFNNTVIFRFKIVAFFLLVVGKRDVNKRQVFALISKRITGRSRTIYIDFYSFFLFMFFSPLLCALFTRFFPILTFSFFSLVRPLGLYRNTKKNAYVQLTSHFALRCLCRCGRILHISYSNAIQWPYWCIVISLCRPHCVSLDIKSNSQLKVIHASNHCSSNNIDYKLPLSAIQKATRFYLARSLALSLSLSLYLLRLLSPSSVPLTLSPSLSIYSLAFCRPMLVSLPLPYWSALSIIRSPNFAFFASRARPQFLIVSVSTSPRRRKWEYTNISFCNNAYYTMRGAMIIFRS